MRASLDRRQYRYMKEQMVDQTADVPSARAETDLLLDPSRRFRTLSRKQIRHFERAATRNIAKFGKE